MYLLVLFIILPNKCASEAGTAYLSGAHESAPGFQWGACYSIFSFICMFCRSFVLLYFFFWPLCCLFFFDIRILIASLWYLQTLLLTIIFSYVPVISYYFTMYRTNPFFRGTLKLSIKLLFGTVKKCEHELDIDTDKVAKIK